MRWFSFPGLLLLLLLVHKFTVSAYQEDQTGVGEVNTRVLLNEEVTARSVPTNKRGGAGSGAHGFGGRGFTGGAGHGGGNGENGDRTPNMAGVIPIYVAGANHHHHKGNHGVANISNGSIGLATIVTATLTFLLFTFS